jgi:hypothetical protein
MNNKIDYILQIEGQNVLQVVYKSGANRFIYPDGWGCYGPHMTRTQLDFMSNSYTVILDGWRNVTYYLDKNSPNKAILSAVKGV